MKRKESSKQPVYVWELPIRWFHWINALAITVLIITGLYIGAPFTLGVDPSAHVMGWVRVTHFIAAYVFSLCLLFRIYWMFVGNEYAKSNPLRLSFWKELWKTVKYYLFLEKHPHAIGHNNLAQMAYWVFMGAFGLVQILTGFALEGEPYANTWKGAWLEVLRNMLGPSDVIRYIHHLAAWGFIVFIFVHLYLVFRADVLENNGEVSSMFNGFKFIEPEKAPEEARNEYRSARLG